MNNDLNIYVKYFALHDATFSRVEHEDAIVAIVYKISQRNAKDYILKICTRPGDYFCEFYFLNYFANKLPVPRVINFLETKEKMHGAILMEYLPGSVLKIEDLTATLTYEIGSLLTRIHENKAAGYGDLTQPNSLSVDPTSYFTFKFDEGLAECCNHLPQKILDRVRDFYYTHIQLLDAADGPCVVHRDFRPGNIIVYENKIQGIIDWASARGSFAQEDFCNLELGDWSTKESLKKSFLEGYRSVRPVPNYHEITSLLRLSKAIAAIGFTVKTGTWENKNANLYEKNRKILEEFL